MKGLGVAFVSWDKGAHSQQNQLELKEMLDLVVLPQKSTLTDVELLRENSPEFKLLRRKQSGVESTINTL